MKFVIVGSGPAAIFAAEAIRKRDKESAVTLVTADQAVAHSPVMLSYWMAGNRPREALFFRDSSWPEKMGIDVRCGKKAASLHPSVHRIRLTDGQEIDYERLLIATGANPISLPIPGIKSNGVASLRRPEDMETILGESAGVKEVVIIGGGFIGLKLACHLRERGLNVTVLEKEPKLAVRMFDLRTSLLVQEEMRQRGILVETGVEVGEVIGDQGRVSGVATKQGALFPCQRVVEAVGVKPNAQWVKGSGIDSPEGILVNERLETNIPGIYAAGDVTLTIDSISSERINNATWPSATRQGAVAGTNMAGGHSAFVHNFAMNALHLFGLHVMAAGLSHYDDNGLGLDLLSEEHGRGYRKTALRDGRLIGFILVGDTSEAGSLLSQLRRGGERSHLPPNLGYGHGLIYSGHPVEIAESNRRAKGVQP